MAIFEVQGADGRIYEVEAPSMQEAVKALQSGPPPDMIDGVPEAVNERRERTMKMQVILELEKRGQLPAQYAPILAELRKRGELPGLEGEQAQPQTNMVEQSMSGVNEGIANMVGFPVDAVTGALNLGMEGINRVAGTDLQPIESPVGGSESIRGMLAPTISETQPQTAAQRYGRRIGQEVGASVVPGGAMMRSAQAPARVAMGTGVSAVGAGLAGQTSREVAPDSDIADFVASTLGGGIAPLAAHAMQPRPKAPTMQQLEQRRDAGYADVRRSNATLSPQSSENLATSIEGTFGPRAATKRLNPKAAIASDELTADLRAAPPTIGDVDDIRRWIGENVAGSREPSEKRIGLVMKDTIDNHLDNLTPGDVTGTNRPNEIIDTLKDARAHAHRIHKAKTFEAQDTGVIDKATRRAATTGTGGNEVNAIRQNVRRILENPKLRKGYSPDELQAMRDIADGTPTQNALRWASRFAPSSGALPGAGGGAGLTAAAWTGNPLWLAPSALGEGAKHAAEYSTRKQVKNLGELIRNGAPLPKKEMSDSTRRIALALLARQAAGQQFTGKSKAIVDALIAGQ